MLLQQKHKIILPNLQTNPKNKLKKKKIIKPPKQIVSKQFFQQQFSKYNLLQLSTAACSLKYPKINYYNKNKILTLYYLNTAFYQNTTWAQTHTGNTYYNPYSTISTKMLFYSNYNKNKYNIHNYINNSTKSKYYKSISIKKGQFSKKILSTYNVKLKNQQQTKPLPIILSKYNPALNNSKSNKVFLTSILTNH